jgi:uncharacterized protein YceK
VTLLALLSFHKTKLINIDIAGSGCTSVLFTTSELISGSTGMRGGGYFGNFLLGYDSKGNAKKMIELDVPYGAKLSLDATDVQVEASDLIGDGIKDLVIRKNGAVLMYFKQQLARTTQI